jgi:hypothetical protein
VAIELPALLDRYLAERRAAVTRPVLAGHSQPEEAPA